MNDMVECEKCGLGVGRGYKFCPSCGTEQKQTMIQISIAEWQAIREQQAVITEMLGKFDMSLTNLLERNKPLREILPLPQTNNTEREPQYGFGRAVRILRNAGGSLSLRVLHKALYPNKKPTPESLKTLLRELRNDGRIEIPRHSRGKWRTIMLKGTLVAGKESAKKKLHTKKKLHPDKSGWLAFHGDFLHRQKGSGKSRKQMAQESGAVWKSLPVEERQRYMLHKKAFVPVDFDAARIHLAKNSQYHEAVRTEEPDLSLLDGTSKEILLSTIQFLVKNKKSVGYYSMLSLLHTTDKKELTYDQYDSMITVVLTHQKWYATMIEGMVAGRLKIMRDGDAKYIAYE